MARACCFLSQLLIAFIVQSALSAGSPQVKVQINSGNPVFPFPQFYAYQNPTDTLDNCATRSGVGVTHAEMEQTIRDAYQIMMNRAQKTGTKFNGVEYLKFRSNPDCSEGDGYALLGAAAMADKTTFDGLWLWIHDNALHKAISYSTGQPTDPSYEYSALVGWLNNTTSNTATDGDVDVALALYTAYCQWGEFMGINDSKGNPISYKHDCIAFLKALNDTFSRPGKPTHYDCGDIGLDGYIKNGDTGNELTGWANNTALSGFPKQPEYGGADMVYVDYSAPAYFHEFADFFSQENPSLYAWNIKQFQRCEASCDWLIGQMLPNPRMIPSAGHVTLSSANVPTFTQMNEGEDFRLAWRTILNYIWHGNPQTTWDPDAHQPKANTPNTYERDIGLRFAKFLWDTRQAPWGNECTTVMNAGYQYWGPPVIKCQYDVLGNPLGTFFLNWVPATGSPSAIASQDFDLIAELYRQCELTWDAETPGDGYLTSVPKYYHGWFRLFGLLALSGNYQAPSKIKAGANMKVYMAIDKTFGFEKDSVTYTIDYRNFGSLDAQTVTIVDTLHQDFKFLSATGGGVYNAASHIVTWNIGTVPGFKTATGVAPTKGQVKLVVRVANATQKQYRNRATIACSNGTGWTSNEYPNNITTVMERNYLDIAKHALIIDQTASVPTAKAGTDVEFTIRFENSSEAGWINGGRPGVHFAYSMAASTSSGPSNVMRFRLFHDADEAYIDYGNYRVSYFLFDDTRDCYQGAAGCANGWNVTWFFVEGIDKNYITLFQENIIPGQDSHGKWNQRFVVQFSDPTNPKRVINLAATDCLLQWYYGVVGGNIHRGGSSPLRIAWDLHTNYNPPVHNWSGDWSWDPNAVDNEGGMYYPITNDWTDLEKPDIPVKTWNPKACSNASHTVDNILVEEWDGYTWRRVAGNGPLPGRDVTNVTIRDTIPAGFTFKNFDGRSPLGVSPKITGNVITWSKSKMQIKEKDSIVFTATAAGSCPLQSKRVVNRAWISADRESPFSDSAIVTFLCDSNPIDTITTASTLAFIGLDLQPVSDTAKIDSTIFHIIVDDKDQNQNREGPDAISVVLVNPSGNDTMVVTLVETGDTTGVFRTNTPIAITSGPSAKGDSPKMHMDPGDVLWATYVDQFDSTDISKAYLITLASFPMPIRGWLLDANGDGAVDSAAVVYNTAVDTLPDSLTFFFPDGSVSRTVVKGRDALSINGNTLAITFSLPFEKGKTAFTSGVQGSATAYLTAAGVGRKIVIPVADSVGPVIVDAQVVERLDDTGVDTLYVTFSEAIKASTLIGASLIIRNATETIISVDAARQLLPNRFAVAISAAASKIVPKTDSLRINPAGPLRDVPLNAAHLLNPAVVITLKEAAPSIVKAWYVDRDVNGADGIVDTAIIWFNKKVSPGDLSLLLDWGNGLDVGKVADSVLTFSNSDSAVAIALRLVFPFRGLIKTSGTMFILPSFAAFPGESKQSQVIDSAAPVIDNATFFPNTAQALACDTLEVVFSEPAAITPGTNPFVFSGRPDASYGYSLTPISSMDNKTRFCMTLSSGDVLRGGDSVRIEANSSVSDGGGVFQNNPRNRKVPVKVVQSLSDVVISIVRNPFQPDIILDTNGILGNGTAFTIASRKKNALLPDISAGRLDIFDAIGNLVHGNTTLRTTSNGANNCYFFVWNGLNKKNRYVGSGVYIARVKVTGGSGLTKEKIFRVGVKR